MLHLKILLILKQHPGRCTTSVQCPLQGMGFSRSKAKEALQENNHDMEAAIEWLVANCI